MKLLALVSLLSLILTTGFTCSKNAPEVQKSEAPAAESSQEQMAQPSGDPGESPDVEKK